MREPTEEQFLKDVADHKMSVLLDNDVHRHLKFASTGQHSWNQWFTITTWPWFLCISGDMGCFVFTRLDDMFCFFRSAPRDNKGLYINTGYWAEKCEAADRRTNGIERYSEDKFKETVKQYFDEHFEDWRGPYDASPEEHADALEAAKAELWERIEDEVLSAENEYEAHQSARDFKHEDFTFYDFWERDLNTYSYQYVWCCYAIAWGIQQYDLNKKA